MEAGWTTPRGCGRLEGEDGTDVAPIDPHDGRAVLHTFGYPPRIMGHAHHFLSRLDRVSLPHLERALELYRDERLMRFVLHESKLPDGAERVAISLDDPVRGPFVVVTREGQFVTCLGEGMTTGGLPIIKSTELEGAKKRWQSWRARATVLEEIAPAFGSAGALLQRVYDAGDELSREEIIAISALRPLYALEFLSRLYRATTELQDAREVLLREMRRSDRLKPAFHRILRPYLNTQLALGHLIVLVSYDGPRAFEELPEGLRDKLNGQSWTWGIVRQGIHCTTLKAVWSAARVGKPVLGSYKDLFTTNESLLLGLDSGMCLIAIGARHAKLSAEVRKALAQGSGIAEHHRKFLIGSAVVELLPGIAEMDPDDSRRRALAAGRRMAILATRCVPRGAPFAYEREEDVPEDIALPLSICAPASYLRDPDMLLLTLVHVPWVARARVEELYLPRAFLRATCRPWEPEDTLPLLRAHRDYYHVARARPTEPTRSGPCPCQSGKKFKRCCGVGAPAV